MKKKRPGPTRPWRSLTAYISRVFIVRNVQIYHLIETLNQFVVLNLGVNASNTLEMTAILPKSIFLQIFSSFFHLTFEIRGNWKIWKLHVKELRKLYKTDTIKKIKYQFLVVKNHVLVVKNHDFPIFLWFLLYNFW